MKKKIFGLALILAGCSPRSEFPPETVQAYQSDSALRAATLEKCSAHAAGHTPFATQADTEECRKAAEAQGNVNFAAHVQREREGNARAAEAISEMAGGSPTQKP